MLLTKREVKFCPYLSTGVDNLLKSDGAVMATQEMSFNDHT